MRLFIAEKPSLGKAIAAGLGNAKPGNGFISCGDDVVTWCFGHIMEQYEPEDYDEKFHVWRFEDLPIIPKEWKIKVKKSCAQQYKIIKELVSKADVIVNAGDPDREGQLLVDEVLASLGVLDNNKKTVQRILLNALDDKSVKDALKNLQDNKNFRGLRFAALARQRGDWTIGMNLTRIYTLRGRNSGYNFLITAGRVQSVVLSIIVRREMEIKNFVPHDFYNLQVLWNRQKDSFATKWEFKDDIPDLDSEGRLLNSEPAKTVLDKIKNSSGTIIDVKQKSGSASPRLPYSLSALQIEAGKKYGYSPQQVLDTQQELYEMKLTSYPRSDCEYLPENQLADVPVILKNLSGLNSDFETFVKNGNPNLKSKAWNDRKISAHHAIIPTRNKADVNKLNEMQRNLYCLIAKAYIAQFYPPEQFITTNIKVECNGELFSASGKIVSDIGWKCLYKDIKDDSQKEDTFENQKIPNLAEGDTVDFDEGKIISSTTKPPSRFTPASLIQAMKDIYKFVKDPSLKQQLKDCSGIGTEATRATIIEELQTKKYAKLSGKHLVPTEYGKLAYSLFSSSLTYPDITAQWENDLSLIENNKMSLADFSAAQEKYTKVLIQEAIDKKITPPKNVPLCPKCKKPLIRRKGKSTNFFWGCSGYPDCKTTFPDNKGKPDFNFKPKAKGSASK